MLSTIAIAICLLLLVIFGVVIFTAVWMYIIVAMLGVAALLGVMWLANARFVIKQNGVKVGTYTRKGGFRSL